MSWRVRWLRWAMRNSCWWRAVRSSSSLYAAARRLQCRAESALGLGMRDSERHAPRVEDCGV